MIVERKDSRVTLNIDSELGTCSPVYPLTFNCGGDQELAELLARQLNEVIKKKLEKIAIDHYEKGWKDAKSKRRKNSWANIPTTFG